MTNANLAAFAALALVPGVVLYAVLVCAWRIFHDEGKLRLQQVLRRRGASLASAGDMIGHHQAAAATRRCMACASKAECDAWLASGAREGIGRFCPNADFVERAARTR